MMFFLSLIVIVTQLTELLEVIINLCPSRIAQWAFTNLLALNPSKNKAIMFGNKNVRA